MVAEKRRIDFPESKTTVAREDFRSTFRKVITKRLEQDGKPTPITVSNVVLIVESKSDGLRPPIEIPDELRAYLKEDYLHDFSTQAVRISPDGAEVMTRRGAIYGNPSEDAFIPVFPADRSIAEEIHSTSTFDFEAETHTISVRQRIPLASGIPLQDRVQSPARLIQKEMTTEVFVGFGKLVEALAQRPDAQILQAT